MVEAKRKVKIPLYGGILSIVISSDPNAHGAAKRHFKLDDKALEFYDAVCLGSDCEVMPVIFSRKITPGLIAHESLHIVNKVFSNIGQVPDRKNDEAEAYLLSWIVNRIWEVKTEYEKKLKANEKSDRDSK